MRCLNTFWCQESLSRHQEYCNEYEAVKIELLEKGTMLKYKNHHRSENVPFIIYADFESYIKPLQSCDPNPESSYTKQYQKHEPSSFCYYIKCFDDKIYEPKLVSYTGYIPEKKMIFGEKEKKKNDSTRKLNVGYVTENSLVMLKVARLETIAILLVDIEEMLIKYAISCIKNLILRPWCFITSVGTIATHS